MGTNPLAIYRIVARLFVALVLLALSAPRARGDELSAELLAATDDTLLVDVHGQGPQGPQHGWLIFTRTEPFVKRMWRQLPKTLGHASCEASTREFSKLLEELSIVGVSLDSRQCGKNDRAWIADAQRLVASGGEDKSRHVSNATPERLKQNRDALAFGAFAGKLWSARFSGKYLTVNRGPTNWATVQTGLQPTPATGWVAATASGLLVAFDAGYGGFQIWVRSGNKWVSMAMVDALDLN